MTTGSMDTAVESRPENARQRDLGLFLRSRRERIAPEEVGLRGGGRRRTPGLRREEVAQLSGVSTTWYTWLEQGRDIQPSGQVLRAVSSVLRLDADEQRHLLALAGMASDWLIEPIRTVSAPMQAVLDQLDPFPACIHTDRYDVLAWNQGFRFLIGTDFEELDERNCVWLTFNDPDWRAATMEWDLMAHDMVANLRAGSVEHPGDPHWVTFVERMRASSPDFASTWDRFSVREIGDSRLKSYRHRTLGVLDYVVTRSWLAPRSGDRMSVFVPANESTRKRIAAAG